VSYRTLFLTALIIMFVGLTSQADDWLQWRGASRDGKSTETNLLKSWPKAGPRMIWSIETLGKGYSSPAIENGVIYINGMLKKQGILFALDLNGKEIWKTPYGREWTRSFPGTRSMPTIDGNRIYLLSGQGVLVCFDKKTGKIDWSLDAHKKFNGKMLTWGMGEAVLIVDDKVICTPGGPDATMVALDKTNGQTIWTTKGLSDKSGYCSPMFIERGGRKIIITQTFLAAVGIDAADGKLLWRDTFTDYQTEIEPENPNTPLYLNGEFYITSGYGDGGTMFRISPDGTQINRKWADTTLDCHHGHVVLVDGYIYGSSWDTNRHGNWVCLQWETGKVMYDTKWHGKGCILYADGMLYCYEETKGNFALVKPDPQEFRVVSSFKVPLGKGENWAHPVISNGILYIRHGPAFMAYDIKAQQSN